MCINFHFIIYIYTTQYPADEETVLILLERVNEAQRLAVRELKEMQAQDPRHKKKRKASHEGDADDGEAPDHPDPAQSSSSSSSSAAAHKKKSKNRH